MLNTIGLNIQSKESETVHVAEWYAFQHAQGSELNPTGIYTRQTCRVCFKNVIKMYVLCRRHIASKHKSRLKVIG